MPQASRGFSAMEPPDPSSLQVEQKLGYTGYCSFSIHFLFVTYDILGMRHPFINHGAMLISSLTIN